MDNTVFVIGAGASNEVGLPTGAELKENIKKLLDIRFDGFNNRVEKGDKKIAETLKIQCEKLCTIKDEIDSKLDHFIRVCHVIKGAISLPGSIDEYIESHKDDEHISFCGKLAIVRSILEAEKSSSLYFDTSRSNFSEKLKALESTWYIRFFQVLTKGGCDKYEIKERLKTITLIIFNYDRCVEYFMFNALKVYYNIPDDEVTEMLNSLKIFHPYGSIGALPWYDRSDSMVFGGDPESKTYLSLSQKIKTFTEVIDTESHDIMEMHKHMAKADKLIFLGFSFNELNMKLIMPQKRDKSFPKCFATAYKISPFDMEIIIKNIKNLYNLDDYSNFDNDDVQILNKSCVDFFGVYSRGLLVF